MLQIRNLVKKFDTTVAVDGVSLDVQTSEFVVLLGPSGCGKTTTLRCIAGLEEPDEGEILIDGKVVNDLSPKERDISMVFQNYSLYPHLTAYGNIAFPLRMHKTRKEELESRVVEIAKLLNIAHLLSRKPSQLSGGEQQRVALGRAIVRRPKVFLMDEPLSNLDAKLRLYMRTEIKRLQKDLGITTVYVTHDQAEAMAMADTVAVMNNGRVEQRDSPTNIYRKPATTFIAGFLGSPPMNFVRARVTQHEGFVVLDAGMFGYQPPLGMMELVTSRLQGEEVFIGVRPEDLQVSPEKGPSSMFEAEVYVVEPMGATVVVDLKAGDYLLRAMGPLYFGLDIGQRVWVGFAPDKVHLFDAKNEKAI